MLAYKCVTDELKFQALAPLEASIFYFFNGERTYEDIQNIWLYVHDVGIGEREVWLDRLDLLLTSFMSDGIVAMEGELSPSLCEGATPTIPDFSNYRYPIKRTSRPVSVSIALTNKCHTDCMYCYAERDKCNEFTFEQLVQLFDQLARHSIYIVDIAGGDLFTRADALDVLREMVKREFVFSVSSKCYFSPQTTAILAEYGIGTEGVNPHLQRSLQISVDSVDNKTASFLTNCKDYLKRVDKSIENLLKGGIKPRIKCVLTSYNNGAPKALLQHFIDKGITKFQFVQYGRSYYRHNDKLFLTKEQKLKLRESIPHLRDLFAGVEITFQDDISVGDTIPDRSHDGWNKRAVCSGGRTNLLIMPNGDVTLCDQIPHRSEFVVGNILGQDLLDIWNSDKLLKFIYPPSEYFKNSVCFTCPTFDECHQGKGYCYRDSLFSYGTLYDAPPNCPRQSQMPVRQL